MKTVMAEYVLILRFIKLHELSSSQNKDEWDF